MSVREILVTNTLPEHALQVSQTVCEAFGVPLEECADSAYSLQAAHILNHIRQFPEGQFVALDGDKVIGMAATMRTNYPPTAPALKWLDAIGGLAATNHELDGEWLYGIEFAVRPSYRRMGVGTKLYDARFAMIKRLNLRGFYAGGMTMGYGKYRDQMSIREYSEKVISGELYDPTVSMQIHNGFKALAYIEDYLPEHASGNGAILILWDNPEYQKPYKPG